MGRLLTFMARIRKDNGIKAGEVSRGVGVDEHTALLLDVGTGDVRAVGVGTGYVCSVDHNAELCIADTPLTFHCKNITLLSCLVPFTVFIILSYLNSNPLCSSKWKRW